MSTPPSKYGGEEVLVIPISKLPPPFNPLANAVQQVPDGWLGEALEYRLFLPREIAEENPNFRQIIPYCVIVRELGCPVQSRKALLYKRGKVGAEARLHAKYSLGVGGHINPVDISPTAWGLDLLYAAMYRELQEEIGVTVEQIDRFAVLGLLNDDSPVGQVHLGVLFEVYLKPSQGIRNLEECLVDPQFWRYSELMDRFQDMEVWSQLAMEALAPTLDVPPCSIHCDHTS